MKIEGKTALAMALFVVAVFMLASKFMLPTTVQVYLLNKRWILKMITGNELC